MSAYQISTEQTCVVVTLLEPLMSHTGIVQYIDSLPVEEVTGVVLDWCLVRTISTPSIVALVHLRQAMKRRGISMVMCDVSEQILSVWRSDKLDTVLTVRPTRELAVASALRRSAF